MATRKPQKASALPEARLRPDQIQPALQRLEALIQVVAAFDTTRLTKRYSDEQRAISDHIANEIAGVFSSGTAQEKLFGSAQKLDHTPIQTVLSSPGTVHEIRRDVEQAKGRSLEILRDAVAWVQRHALARP